MFLKNFFSFFTRIKIKPFVCAIVLFLVLLLWEYMNFLDSHYFFSILLCFFFFLFIKKFYGFKKIKINFNIFLLDVVKYMSIFSFVFFLFLFICPKNLVFFGNFRLLIRILSFLVFFIILVTSKKDFLEVWNNPVTVFWNIVNYYEDTNESLRIQLVIFQLLNLILSLFVIFFFLYLFSNLLPFYEVLILSVLFYLLLIFFFFFKKTIQKKKRKKKKKFQVRSFCGGDPLPVMDKVFKELRQSFSGIEKEPETKKWMFSIEDSETRSNEFLTQFDKDKLFVLSEDTMTHVQVQINYLEHEGKIRALKQERIHGLPYVYNNKQTLINFKEVQARQIARLSHLKVTYRLSQTQISRLATDGFPPSLMQRAAGGVKAFGPLATAVAITVTLKNQGVL